MGEVNPHYVGFWARVGAALIDTCLLLLVILPPLVAIYGPAYFHSKALLAGPADFVLSYLVPAGVVILFWRAKSATPGKLLIGARIVDAHTGAHPATRQFVIRYLGYYLSTLPFCLGLLWVAFDPRKQGWHDKLAGTMVVYRRSREEGATPSVQ